MTHLKRWTPLVWALVAVLLLPSLAFAQGNCSVYKTFGTSEILTASDLNNSLTQASTTNSTFACLNDYSATAAQMRTETDPGENGSESLATSGAGELERLRFALRRLHGGTYWYSTPSPFIPPGDVQVGILNSRTNRVAFHHSGSSFVTGLYSGNATQSADYFLPTAYPTVTGQPLTATTAGQMSWATSLGATVGGTAQTSWTTGDLLYASGSNTLAKLAIGSADQVLTVSGGVPTWAAGSSAVTEMGENTTEATTTSTTVVDLVTISTTSIATNRPFWVMCGIRKSAGAAADASVGLSLNATAVRTAVTWSDAGNAAQSGTLLVWVPAQEANYLRSGYFAASGAATSGIVRPFDVDMPNAAITSVVVRGLVSDAAITMGVDNCKVWAGNTF